MFDLGWPELFIIIVVTLVVVGPKELPGVLRTVTGAMRKARGMARELQRGIEDIAKESGVKDLKRDLDQGTGVFKSLTDDPDLKDDVDDALAAPANPKSPSPSILSPAAAQKMAADKAAAETAAKTSDASPPEPAAGAEPETKPSPPGESTPEPARG